MASTRPERQWTAAQLADEAAVSKEALVGFLQAHAAAAVVEQHKLNGEAATVAAGADREVLVSLYEAVYAGASTEAAAAPAPAAAAPGPAAAPATAALAAAAAAAAAPPVKKYTKSVLKKGDKVNYPRAGDQVAVKYKGQLDSGVVFDTNMDKKSKQPLRFKVGKGIVIRGWDEALMTMSKGETAQVVIESDWAYGKKGKPEAGIPPNSRLTFEIELVDIN